MESVKEFLVVEQGANQLGIFHLSSFDVGLEAPSIRKMFASYSSAVLGLADPLFLPHFQLLP